MSKCCEFHIRKKKIRILIMDVDGTLTDGKIYIGNYGEAFKSFYAKDGFAIRNLLSKAGVIPAVITGRQSEITEKRCLELGIIHIRQGIKNKLPEMMSLLESCGLTLENAAYIGDDINDLECIQAAALSGCPADAADAIISCVNFICKKSGGNGAVREFIEWLLK